MKLILARHAQTNFNVLRLLNADPTVDVHLSEEGIRQAESLADQLRDVDYDVIYISEFPRTRQTAEIINKYHHKEFIVEPLLNDIASGFENRPVQEWFDAINATDDRFAASINDGESINAAFARGARFIEELKTKDYQSVLVITHGTMTQAIYGYIEGLPVSEAVEFDLTQGTYATLEV